MKEMCALVNEPSGINRHHPPGGAGAVYIDLLLTRLVQGGNSQVLHYKDRWISATDLLKSIFQYARVLAGIGIERGSVVALFAPNCPEALAIRYAANLLGAATTYLSAPFSAQRRMELLTQTDPALLVLFPETCHLLPNGVGARVAAIGTDLASTSLRLDELAATQSGSPLESLARPDDLAVIVSSGGTTGVPKGSWRNFAVYTAFVHVPSPADRRQLINGPLAYLSQVLVDMTLLGGGSVVLEKSYDAANTLATIESERITDLFLVEPQLFEVMDHPDVVRRDLSSLRTLTHVGDSAPPVLRIRARKRLGAVLAHTYGASEMGVVSSLSPAEHDLANPDLFTCAGRIRPGVDVRFRLGDGTLANSGEAGSIEVRSPAMAGGYRNRPDSKEHSFEDGWYRSGDLGFLDTHEYLHIMGRADDIAWIDGAMVSPMLIQNTLCQLSNVRYAAVVRDRKANLWVAAVVPWPDSSVDTVQCRKAIADQHGVLPILVVPLDRVPLTEQGKPDSEAICQLGHQASRK
jgi:acyl-CoA synthetase (AMP-forming)/AMP-acid ligase II